ncbi:protein S100-A12-like [Eublepharis macularius]|uniref:Protein S100-A12-like n=1 Tax=Eublepharis macularius TaxID=481883 RepID=A0AA97LCL5_EUBMA|nr:protein S100-A12-like [Eublepharis macularius]XP_054850429.1 protein S100-A12-like [Eublepharis macularius]
MSETQLEKCCECVINVFHQYSIRVDHFDMLSKGELKKLIEQQMPNFLKKKKDPKSIDRIFEELDKDKSGQITFEEFMVFMTRLLIACHDHIHQKEGQGQGQHGHGHSH